MNLDYEAAKAESDTHQGGPGLRRHKIKKIVDAAVPKPCVHGNYAPHLDTSAIYDWATSVLLIEIPSCDGMPEADE